MTNFYIYYKHGFGLRKSFRFAFGITLRDFLLDAVFYTLIVALLASLINLGLATIDETQASENRRQAAYTKALESILGTCLKPGDNALVVEGELGFCGLAMTGIKI